MRTTILLPDRLGSAARSRAREAGLSFSALVARALEAHLAARPASPETPPPFRLLTVGGPGTHDGVNLDRTSEIWTAEDEARYRGYQQASSMDPGEPPAGDPGDTVHEPR